MAKSPTMTPRPKMPAQGSLCRTRSAGKRFLLGAAIGTGVAAKAAERGGADFLLALNAGRFRSMGMPSAACLLALRDANRMVMEFGRSEILTQTSLPVFFGAAALGTDHVDTLIEQIAQAGFHGVTNFPSCIFLDGRYRQYLEASGLGFSRELALLQAARARGLSTLAYVHTLEEASAAAASVDIVNLDFGWNMGGLLGVQSSVDLDEAVRLGRAVVEAVRGANAQTPCMIEGGPIVTPEQMDQVCRVARADGYIGGSTIDRVPLESAIEMATGAFKTIGALRQQIEALERKLHRKATVDALIGHSAAIERAREQVAQAMESELPTLIVGESGTGRHALAKVIHEASVLRGRGLFHADCRVHIREEMALLLFGYQSQTEKCRIGLLEIARGSSVVLDNVESLDLSVQRELLQAFQAGMFWPRGGNAAVPLDVRLIGISSSFLDERDDGRFSKWLSALRVELPPLRDHLEDLPLLAESLLRSTGKDERKNLAPSAYRILLGYGWPGNLAELRTVLQSAAMKARSQITDAEVVPLLTFRAISASDRKSFSSEREWILDGLRRNRFRRTETARFLRISRKTLYNKIREYGLQNITSTH
jgi:predicted TIM-barrel enzyme/DNA-binding NtrC family response regulator